MINRATRAERILLSSINTCLVDVKAADLNNAEVVILNGVGEDLIHASSMIDAALRCYVLAELWSSVVMGVQCTALH